MATQLSYNLTNPARSVQPIFDDLIKGQPSILSIIKKGANFNGAGTTGAPKLEWLDRQLSQTTWTNNGFVGTGAGTGIIFTDTTGLLANDILIAQSSTGQRRSEVIQITSVDSGTTCTVTRTHGSSTLSTFATGDIFRKYTPKGEGSTAVTSGYTAPTANYNYSQIVDRAVAMSKTRLGLTAYGQVKELNGAPAEKFIDLIAQKMLEIQWEMTDVFINGYRSIRSNTTTAPGTAGGLFNFTAGGNINASGSTLTLDHFQDTIELIHADGAPIDNLVAVMNTNMARRVAAFNASSATNILLTDPTSTTVGNQVRTIRGDLGGITQVFVEPSMPKDCIFIINPDFIEVNWLEGRELTDIDCTVPNVDEVARRIMGEFSFTIKNGTTAHGLMTGLTV
jgi:hypothetical protein